MSIDPRELERRARLAYERGRAGAAAWICSPILAAGIGAAALGGMHPRGWALAVIAYAAAVLLWWRGEALARGVLPGAIGGTILLAATFVTHGLGTHACDFAECLAHCAPIDAVGGALTGVLLSAWAVAKPELRVSRWWCSSAIVAATFGCIGCSCVGFIGGLAGIAALSIVVTPAAWVLRRA